MNKTVNINLGGMFFHIDEDAYQKLNRYFDAIKRSLTNSNGQDEIIKDIEMRIGEIISERHTNDKQVINIREVDEIIAIMGQPEDYRIDNDDEPKTSTFNANPTGKVNKKLYRDREKGMIGGVASGLGHYFGIDVVWVRIFFVLFVWLGGSGIIGYIVLWIVMPEAITTAEKLEMTGEPVNISNIERKVREEFDNMSDKIKNANYDKMGNQMKTGAERIASRLGEVFMSIFKVFAKIIGVFLIMSSIPLLITLLIGVFTLGSSAFIELPWQDFIEAGNYTQYPIWSFGLLMLFAVGIPFFYLMILGFKLLITNMKSMGNIVNYTLLAVWIISVAILISIGVNQLTQFAVEGRVVQKENLNLNPADTLEIKFRHSDYFANNINDHKDFMITEDSTGTRVIYSNEISFRIEKAEGTQAYIQIEREAKGKSLSESKKTAEKIKYGYKLVGNKLILDNYLLSDFSNKYRNQEVDIILYLPKGTLFKTDESVQRFDYSNDDFFNLHFSSEKYHYRVDSEKVKCLDCPKEENEYNDVIGADADTTVVTTMTKVSVNGQEVIIKEVKDSKGNSLETNVSPSDQTAGKGLTTDANGVIIKK